MFCDVLENVQRCDGKTGEGCWRLEVREICLRRRSGFKSVKLDEVKRERCCRILESEYEVLGIVQEGGVQMERQGII